MLKLILPYPPTINHYWRHVGQRVLISQKGREYRTAVATYLKSKGVKALTGPLSIDIKLDMPDRRRRDIDNVLKALLDSLESGGAFLDDNQIIRLAIEKVVPAKRTPRKRLTKKEVAAGIQHPVPPEGGVIVWLTEVDTAQHTKANRICLKCHQSFNSKGPANRICVSCNEEQRQMSPVAAPTWIGKRHNGKAM